MDLQDIKDWIKRYGGIWLLTIAIGFAYGSHMKVQEKQLQELRDIKMLSLSMVPEPAKLAFQIQKLGCFDKKPLEKIEQTICDSMLEQFNESYKQQEQSE